MDFKSRVLSLALTVMATLHCSAVAQRKDAPTLGQILLQQQEIRKRVTDGSPGYAALDAHRKRLLLAAQDQVFRVLGRYPDLGSIPTDEQLVVYNALKRIDAILNQRDIEERMVCERAAIAGTRRYQMVCMTEAERRRKMESARNYLEHRPGCTTPECAGN